MNIFREYREHGSLYFICSCGYSKQSENYWMDYYKCPQCGAIKYNTVNKTYQKELSIVEIEKQDVHDKSFEVTKVKYETNIIFNGNTPSLQITKKETYHTIFDFMDNCKLEIRLNDELLSNNKTNIQKALSYVDLTQNTTNNNLFTSVIKYIGKNSASDIVYFIYKNPFIEIFYNTYGDLRVITEIPTCEMNANKTCPNEILGISKPVWKEILSLQNEVSYNINNYFKSIKSLDKVNFNKPDYTVSILKTIPTLGLRVFGDYLQLISKGYDYRRLYQYLTDDIYTYQGISDISNGLVLLRDYIDMCENMNVPYEKYPKSLKLVHDLASKNLKIQIDKKLQEKFNDIINRPSYKNLEYTGCEYSVIIPHTTDDIVNEGRYLHHCVGSYVNRIINGETKIAFLRHNKNINKPLITLEVKNGTLRQYKGNCNRQPTINEMNIISEWANLKKLKVW